jgi:hypothetical protein
VLELPEVPPEPVAVPLSLEPVELPEVPLEPVAVPLSLEPLEPVEPLF